MRGVMTDHRRDRRNGMENKLAAAISSAIRDRRKWSKNMTCHDMEFDSLRLNASEMRPIGDVRPGVTANRKRP